MQTPSKKKTIIVFSLTFDKSAFGGAEIALFEICKRLSPFGFDFIVIAQNTNGIRKEVAEGVTIYRVGPRLRKQYGHISNMYKIGYIFFAYRLASKLGEKYSISIVWSIMANYAGFSGLFFKLFHPRKIFLLTLQEGDSIDHIKKRVGILYPLYKLIFKKANKIHAISTMLASYASAMGYSGNVHVVPNGVDSSVFTDRCEVANERMLIRNEWGVNENQKIILTTSRLVYKNGIDIIIDALKLLPDEYSLVVVGQGPLLAELKARAQKNAVSDRIIWLGYKAQNELPPLLRSADIFTRPSRSEGLGNSFLEAMACGVPIVAPLVGGIKDFLVHKKTGFVCEAESPTSLAETIMFALYEETERARVVKNAKECIMQRYTWKHCAMAMKSFLEYENEK